MWLELPGAFSVSSLESLLGPLAILDLFCYQAVETFL